MAKYQYTSLDESLHEIRVLTLLPAQFSSAICIELETTVFTKTQSPQYEALSYAWGSKLDPRLISIHHGSDKFELAITESLASALTHLRCNHKPRRMWIDAICINQEDLDERSQQVLRMGDIFTLADRVIAWLGPESSSSSLAIQVLRNMGALIEVDWQRSNITPAAGADASWADVDDTLKLEEVTWKSIYELLSRSWFERLWIQQEIRLANQKAILMCGMATIPWTLFTNAIFLLRFKHRDGLEPILDADLRHRLDTAYGIRNTANNLTFLGLMGQSVYCKYTDARDKIYSLLSVLQDTAFLNGFKPDYTKSVNEVYTEAVLQYIRSTQQLSIMSGCQPHRRLWQLPSWVPDWSASPSAGELSGYCASCRTRSYTSYIGDGILKVGGIRCATIDSLQRIDIKRLDYKTPLPINQTMVRNDLLDHTSAHAAIRKIVRTEILDQPYIGGGNMFDAYCSTFCCDRFATRYHPPRNLFVVREACQRLIRSYLKPRSDELIDELDREMVKCRSELVDNSRGRHFFTTDEGFIGLAPNGTTPGDEIFVLLGCDTPIILRPTPEGKHRVVGECFACGLMDGEAFLGQFPDQWQYVIAFDETAGWHPAYLDRATGSISYKDPRLGVLPVGWQMYSRLSEGVPLAFSYQDSGDSSKVSFTGWDPRLEPQALIDRSIVLREFLLV